MAGRDPRRERVNAAAARLVDGLASDPDFAGWLAGAEIERQIEAGTLIRTDALRLTPGLTLVPLHLVEQLKAHLRALAEHPKVAELKGKDIMALRSRCLELADGAEMPADAAAAPSTPKPEPDPEPEPKPPADADGGNRPTPAGWPEGPAPCSWDGCKEIVDEDQARKSWVRWREPLCIKHHKEKRRKAA